MLQERFREFARDTGNIGQERVDTVNHMADELINSGHSDAATIAEWKDGLNEAWADLLELLDTRGQVLAAAYELQRFLHGARQALARVQQKQQQLPDGAGRDLNAAEALQRRHCAFEHDIQALSAQVRPEHVRPGVAGGRLRGKAGPSERPGLAPSGRSRREEVELL